MTCREALKVSVGWLGAPLLEVIWPWALLLLAVPLLYLLLAWLQDLRRLRSVALLCWSDLAALLAASALVLLALAQGRARSGQLWSSRYCMLQVPLAVSLFLLLARRAAPQVLTAALAVAMAISVGWCWPSAIGYSRVLRAERSPLNTALCEGHEALSVLVERYSNGGAGWWRQFGRMQDLVANLHRLRQAGLSLFAQDPTLARRCLYWHAESGLLPRSLQPVADPQAVGYRAVEAPAKGPMPTALYEISVPADGIYQLCCRWREAAAGAAFTVAVDAAPPLQQEVPGGPDYVPVLLREGLRLRAGKHQLRVSWPGPKSRLDLLELNPQ